MLMKHILSTNYLALYHVSLYIYAVHRSGISNTSEQPYLKPPHLNIKGTVNGVLLYVLGM
jgi:hypothetical protein